MASNGTIAHRFANKDYNFEKGLKGSSTHIDGRNYYSYSTVFGQWVDEKVCVVFHGETSVTSHKHFLWGSDFPKDVILLPYDDGGSLSYYGGGWHGCDLLGYGEDFELRHRWKLMDYWMGKIFSALEAINGGKTKYLDMHAAHTIEEYWKYMELLCSLYKDTTLPKYINRCDTKYKKLAKALKDGEREVSVLVDLLFGEGTYKTYLNYCARYRKQSDKRAKMEQLCNRLGIGSPYVKYRGYRGMMSHTMTADQIRKLTAKERVELHFKALAYKEYNEHEKERREKYYKNSDNAYMWITGYTPVIDSVYCHDYKAVKACRNMFTGQEYTLPQNYVFGFYWCKKEVRFKYDEFRKADDKEQWIREFYALCEEVQNNTVAISLLKSIHANIKPKAHSYDDDIYLDDEHLRNNTTEADYAICSEFIRKQDKHFADEEARRRAAEIARLQREEEERKEREFQEQVKQEQIDECLERGEEGCRDLWRKHLMDIHYAERETNYKGDFFMGGNVLLRLNLNKDKVETSKGIRIPVEICKKMWKIVSKWHENPACFKEMQIDTKGSGKYTISSYRNDILTAGCHDIAYAEMERMYNEIVKLESEAA